jgi:hypothetical protein
MALDLHRLEKVKMVGSKVTARCPACAEADGDDKGDHLAVFQNGEFACIKYPGPEGEEHRKRIFALAGKEERPPMRLPPRAKPKGDKPLSERPHGEIRYVIVDEPGEKIEHVRWDFTDEEGGKTFKWCRNGAPTLDGKKPEDLPLYGSRKLAEIPRAVPVVLVEGEKAADALIALGCVAVATITGARDTGTCGCPNVSALEALRGRPVFLWADNDKPGRAHMDKIAVALTEVGVRARMIRWRDAPDAGDASDFIATGGTMESISRLIAAALPWIPTEEARAVTFTAEELEAEELPTLNYFVHDLLHPGVTLVSAKIKVGKSFFILCILLALVQGGVALGQIPVQKAAALYAFLEGSKRGLKDRMRRHMPGGKWPPGLHFSETWRNFAKGGLEDLMLFLEAHQDVKVVVFDVWPRVRPPRAKNDDPYAADYRDVSQLKAIADRFGICIILVCHLRKNVEGDLLDAIHGSIGLAAAADTLIILQRERGRSDAVMYVSGRDVPENEYAMKWDKVALTWNIIGDADDYRMSQERAAILKVIRESMEAPTPKLVADILSKPYANVKQLMYNMSNDGILRCEGGKYYLPDRERSNIKE